MTTHFEHEHQLKPKGIKPNIDNPQVPRVLHWFPAAFLIGVVVLGAVSTFMNPAARVWPVAKSIVTGAAQAEYEKNNLDTNVPWRDSSVNLWGGLNYRLFGEARDGAVIGQDGWLFTTEEFQTDPKDAAEIADKLAYIKQVRDNLAKDGAKLVIVLIPAKTRIYADEVGAAKQPAQWQPIYQDFRHQVEAMGIPAPDLETAFKQAQKPGHEVFLHTDTHWTPYGAVVAAQTLAPAIKDLGLDLPPATYGAATKPPVQRKGDLLRYVPVPDGTGPTPDTVREPTYTRTDGGGGGLLGNDSIPVTLVGTSYSAETKQNVWHFEGALARVLGTQVVNAAEEGKGPVVPMREYLKSQTRKDSPPQLVVWEIPERFLRVE